MIFILSSTTAIALKYDDPIQPSSHRGAAILSSCPYTISSFVDPSRGHYAVWLSVGCGRQRFVLVFQPLKSSRLQLSDAVGRYEVFNSAGITRAVGVSFVGHEEMLESSAIQARQ